MFVHLTDPGLAPRFEPMREALDVALGGEGSVYRTQAYLAGAVASTLAVKGGGISAMPAMHLGAASIYVLAARRTRWMVPALAFWAIIFIGSAYFGYHYWIDGIVAAAVALVCWKLAEAYYERRLSPAPRAVVSHA